MIEDFAHKTCHLCSAVVDDLEAHRDYHWHSGQWPKCREALLDYEPEGRYDHSGECELRLHHPGRHFVDLHTVESVPGVPGVVRTTGEHWWPEA